MRSLILLIFVVLTNNLMAQEGTISGNLFKTENGEVIPLAMAKLVELEDGKFQRTDFDGNFSMTLTAGVHHIVVMYTGIKDTLEITVKEGENPPFTKDLSMSNELQIFVVQGAISNGGSEIKAAKDIKEDDKVVAVQTAEMMEQKGEGDVGGSVKKITGLSTVGSVLYVRGLGDRYNVAYLNGLPLPSPDPDFRVVPLDLFPTDVVSSVQVSKVMSSEFYGDFAGGAFNITTKSFYNKPTLKVSLSTGGNSQTVFRPFNSYRGGKFDYFGFDDGTRNIPTEVFTNSKPLTSFPGVNTLFPDLLYNTQYDKSADFSNNFDIVSKIARPNINFSITGGNFFDMSDKKDKSKGFGFLALLKNENSLKYQEGVVKIINAQSEERLNYDVYQYNYETASTGLLNLYYRINPDHAISVNSLFVNKSNDETRETWGYHFDYDPYYVYSRRFTYKQNFLNVNQLIGTHKFFTHKDDKDFARLIVDWRGAYNITGSKEPDRRQLVALYTGDPAQTDSYDLWNALDVNENHRFFSILKENEISAKANARYVLKFKEVKTERGNTEVEELITFNVGADYKAKRRNFDYKQFNYNIKNLADSIQPVDIYNTAQYFTDENHENGLFYIDELANFGSSYVASQNVIGAYIDAKFKFNKLEMIPGIRKEFSEQRVYNRDQTTPSKYNNTIVPTDFVQGLLPSLIFKYEASEKDVLRLAFSKTLTRPKFNEVAPFQYTLFFSGTKAQGNDTLKNGVNYNADFRYERYPSPGEMITIGGFYKFLQNPIEQTMRGTASGQLASFSNAKQGQVAGVEVEYMRSLDCFVKAEKRDSSFLKYFGIGMNASFMWTQVTIDTLDAGNISTNYRRPLEGASPFLLNVDLRYQRDFKEAKKSVLVALAYNVFGRRLVAVGGNGIGDQYALPVNTLNFISKVTFDDRFSVGVKARNLLNPYIKVVQENTQPVGGDLSVSEFRRGIDFSLSVSYNFTQKKKDKK
ncbi:TonB-dependent receptor plug domain-containing protein [Paracrocinitomix mangrovi]|uniref:TonB-dependent receptor plug domain-containing protein n=1 Tax=Paracrocinitomix mangrovi TaxID=2862509 RepID=UPI001C8DCF94|nr:TonB-dependent receptor plug domain-containing protein [Paracrocinitomix mangrovi]UKN00932.1 TonB-dependent receptor plug domain-containing protein [Paracrocinitomix mangrovi]